MKIIVIENIDHCEQRFTTYLNGFKDAEIDFLYSIGFKTEKEIFEFLTQSDVTDFMFESTFSNINQMLKLMGVLVKFKDKISFRNISIMYTHKDFETFLNIQYKNDEVFRTLAKDLFSIYNVFSIHWEEFEDHSAKREYFKKHVYFHDLVKIDFEDEVFLYERFPIIDIREKSRKKKYVTIDKNQEIFIANNKSKIIDVDKSFLEGDKVDNFFNEVKAMLTWQQSVIEDNEKSEDYKENLKLNRENQEVLEKLKQMLFK